MKRSIVLVLLIVNFTLPSYAQEDRLGLDVASDQMARKIPVAVASAIEASSAPEALPRILGYYFGGRYSDYQSTQLGNEIQPRVGDLMLQMGYANIIPNSGFQGTQAQDVKYETEIVRVLPKYVVVPTISFDAVDNKGQVVSLGVFAPILGTGAAQDPATRIIIGQVSRSSIDMRNKKVRASFSLRFYDQSGTQVLVEEACPQEITMEELGQAHVGLTYGVRYNNQSTLKPLAVKLMGAMTARLIGRGVCK